MSVFFTFFVHSVNDFSWKFLKIEKTNHYIFNRNKKQHLARGIERYFKKYMLFLIYIENGFNLIFSQKLG